MPVDHQHSVKGYITIYMHLTYYVISPNIWYSHSSLSEYIQARKIQVYTKKKNKATKARQQCTHSNSCLVSGIYKNSQCLWGT